MNDVPVTKHTFFQDFLTWPRCSRLIFQINSNDLSLNVSNLTHSLLWMSIPWTTYNVSYVSSCDFQGCEPHKSMAIQRYPLFFLMLIAFRQGVTFQTSPQLFCVSSDYVVLKAVSSALFCTEKAMLHPNFYNFCVRIHDFPTLAQFIVTKCTDFLHAECRPVRLTNNQQTNFVYLLLLAPQRYPYQNLIVNYQFVQSQNEDA